MSGKLSDKQLGRLAWGTLLLIIVLVFLWIVSGTEPVARKFVVLGTVFGALGTVGAFFFVGYQAIQLEKSVKLQTDQIELQAEEYHLEKRPYLYVHLKNVAVWKRKSDGPWFGGGRLYFKNQGRVPARVIKTQYMVASDQRGNTDFVNWFEEAYGGFPDVKTVFPDQQDAFVPCHPIIGETGITPKLFYVGAVIMYSGIKPNEAYWYKFSRLYVVEFDIEKDDKGKERNVIKVHPHKPDHDWDKNTGSVPPILKEPNWKKYLSKTYITTLTQKGNQADV
ncbi:MAG: hypothetical protein KAV83_13100 [Desulfobacterales bacterium]|nr:hypothetical protein [Desulfobacterales bacterium]